MGVTVVVGILWTLLVCCAVESAAYSVNYDILLSSQYEQQVAKYSSTGQLLQEDAFRSPTGSWMPSAMEVSPVDGTIVIADTNRDAVHRFHRNGTLMHTFTFPGSPGKIRNQFQNPQGIAIANDGTVYVSSTDTDLIYYWFPNGTYMDRWDVCDAPHHITLYQNMMWTSCGGINSSTAGVVKYGIGLSNGQTVISDSSTSFGKLVFNDSYFYVPFSGSGYIQRRDTVTGAILDSSVASGKEYWALALLPDGSLLIGNWEDSGPSVEKWSNGELSPFISNFMSPSSILILLDCPGQPLCSGQGTCDYATYPPACRCNTDFTGDACEMSVTTGAVTTGSSTTSTSTTTTSTSTTSLNPSTATSITSSTTSSPLTTSAPSLTTSSPFSVGTTQETTTAVVVATSTSSTTDADHQSAGDNPSSSEDITNTLVIFLATFLSVFCVAFFVVTGIVVYALLFKKKKSGMDMLPVFDGMSTTKSFVPLTETNSAYSSSGNSSSANTSTGGSVKSSYSASSQLIVQNSSIQWKDLEIENPPIGSGAYGVVNKAVYRGTTVAVKVFNSKSTNVEDFNTEVQLLITLRHPNVILFIGAIEKPTALVLEYAELGSVADVIKTTPELLDEAKQFSIALDTAKGMAYLHGLSTPLIHRDLKSQNILLDSTWKAKVSDFGISRYQESTMTVGMGTFRWIAPEVLVSRNYTTAADVFSYGTFVWELVAKQTPWLEQQFTFEIEKALLNGERLKIPEHCPQILRNVINKCWVQEPTHRPAFLQLIKELTK